MTGLEIALLIIGTIVLLGSFIFSTKMDEADEAKNAELSEKQREAVKQQIIAVFDQQMDELKDKTEVELDKLSNIKMNEMNEYSENILNEINRNHNEVMFLYDMLNEKKKEVNNTVRDVMAAKKEINETIKVKETEEQNIEDMGFMASEAVLNEEKKARKTTKTAAKAKKEKILDELDNLEQEPIADTKAPAKTKRKTSTAKTAASRARSTVKKETTREENKDINVVTGNNNEKILELNAQGKSNVEIAKELGLGIGEVKLVIDLFRGGK